MLRRSKNFLAKAAGLLALSVSAIALAHTYERCDPDGDHCVRVTCDSDGDKCWKQSEYSNREFYNGATGRWVCDRDGDRCHYQYSGRRWDPHWDHQDRDDDRDR